MIKGIQSIEQKLSPKQVVPQNSQHQLSYYTRFAESFYEISQNINQQEISQLQQRCQIILDQVIQYQFPLQYLHSISTAVANFIISLAKTDGLWVSRAFDTIIGYLNKKGVSSIGRSISNDVLYALLLMRQQLPAISFNILSEISALVIKLIKSSSELSNRVCLARYFCILIQEGVCSKEVIRVELIKYVIKFCGSDRSDQLRFEGLKALIGLVKQGFYQNLDVIVNISYRAIGQEQSYKAQQLAIDLLGQIFGCQIEQERAIQHNLQLKKMDKKNQIQSLQPLSSKEYVIKLFQNFSDSFNKVSKPWLLVQAWQKCLINEVERHGSVIIRGSYEVLVKYMSNKTGIDQKTFKTASEMSVLLLQKTKKQQLTDIMEYLLEKIKALNKISSNQVIIGKLLLTGVLNISNILGPAILYEKLKGPNQLIDQIGEAVQYRSLEEKLQAIDSPFYTSCVEDFIATLRSFFMQNSKWQQNVLQILLNISQIYAADIGEGSQEPDQINRTSNLLRAHSICLVRLLGQIDIGVHSIPMDIGNKIWNTSRSLILEVNSKEGSRALLMERAFQRETGFLILSELLQVVFLQNQIRLKEALQIIQNSMQGLQGSNDLEEYGVQLLGLGKITLVLYRLVGGPLIKYITDSVMKFIVQSLVNMYQFIIRPNIKIDRMNCQLMECKFYLFKALSSISPKLYSSHINNLVQQSVDDVLVSGSSWEDMDEEALILRCEQQYKDDESSIPTMEQCQDELSMALAAIEFFGHIMITKSFTIKNKINLVNYLNTNIATIIALKDASAHARRLIPYILIIRAIQRKLLQNQNEIPDDQVFILGLMQAIQACIGLASSKAIKLFIGQCMTQHFQIKSAFVDQQKILNQLLQNQFASTAYIITDLIVQAKILEQKTDDKIVQLSLQNLFVKLSSQLNLYYEDIIYMISKVSEISTPLISQLIRGTFIFQAFHQMGMNNDAITQAQDSSFNNQIECIIQYFKNTRIQLRDSINSSTYLNTLIGELRFQCTHQNSMIKLVKLNYYVFGESQMILPLFQMLQSNDSEERWQLLPLMEQVIFDYRALYPLINLEFKLSSNQNSNTKQFQRLFIKLLSNNLQGLSTQSQIELIAPYILEEYIDINQQNINQTVKKNTNVTINSGLIDKSEGKAIEQQLSDNDNNNNNNNNTNKIENHPNSRLMLMRRASKIFNQYQPLEQNPEQIISTSNYLFTFLFKVASLPIESVRDESFQTFTKLFKQLHLFSETGTILTKNNQRSLLISFAAQTDALISDTLRREDQNSPNTNITNMKLSAQFFELVSENDTTLGLKLINNLCKGLMPSQQQKLPPSQFYSDKSMVLIMLNRISAIDKIINYLETQNRLINKNGSRSSYDSVGYFALLHHVLRLYAYLLQFNLECQINIPEQIQQSTFISLICFFLTYPCSIEIFEAQSMSLSNQVNALKILLMSLPHLSAQTMTSIIELLPLLLELNEKEELGSHIAVIICSLSKSDKLSSNFAGQLIICINYLIENESESSKNNRQQLIYSLINLYDYSKTESDRIIYLVWQYMMEEVDYGVAKLMIQRIKQIQDESQVDLIMHSILKGLLNTSEPTDQNIRLITLIHSILTVKDMIDQVNRYVERYILNFMQVAKNVISQSKQIDEAFVSILTPAFAQICNQCIRQIPINQNILIEIIKFTLLIYVVATNKLQYFITVIKSQLLFIEPAFQMIYPELPQISQQAIKHIIAITDYSTIEQSMINQNEKLQLIIKGIYQQIQNEIQARKIEEEKINQQLNQQSAGKIKLKMFGRQ